jgi:hypothetical protein
MTAPLYLSMCSGCTRQYALQGEPAGCEMPGDNGYVCPDCQSREQPVVVVPGRSYYLRDGFPRSRWVVLAAADGMCTIRRRGFPDGESLIMPVSELTS